MCKNRYPFSRLFGIYVYKNNVYIFFFCIKCFKKWYKKIYFFRENIFSNTDPLHYKPLTRVKINHRKMFLWC